MKKGYWVVSYHTVADEATMKHYGELAFKALEPFKVHLLVSPNSEVTALEAGLKQMTVVVEFDSYPDALAAYETVAYKKALAVLGADVQRDFRIAEGS